jgi:hypothetical protein
MIRITKSSDAGCRMDVSEDALFQLAEQRLIHGLARPREIYRIENRWCID